jgi:hypothetical protein
VVGGEFGQGWRFAVDFEDCGQLCGKEHEAEYLSGALTVSTNGVQTTRVRGADLWHRLSDG